MLLVCATDDSGLVAAAQRPLLTLDATSTDTSRAGAVWCSGGRGGGEDSCLVVYVQNSIKLKGLWVNQLISDDLVQK